MTCRIHAPWLLPLISLFCGLVAFPSCAQEAGPTSATSAAGLFTYRRADTAPGGITQIHINTRHTAPWTIQQNVFGNFLEHLGGVVYGGVWADVLHNPNLEKVNDQDLGPQGWESTGSASWQMGGYLSPRCIRFSVSPGTMQQRVFLPVHRIRRFTGIIYTRAPGEPGQISLLVQGRDTRAGQNYAQVSLPVSGSEWRRRVFHFKLPADAPAKGDAEEFVIQYAGGSPVDVDQVSLFPDDAVDGLDPDVIRAARAWHIPILRLAGNFSSGYHWQDGVGPRERRPTLPNLAWGGVESNEFGTDEFMDFARRIGAPVQIAVNAGNGTAEEAAGWVRYCKEHHEPVAIWEVGNELYGGWQIGHTDAAGNADRFVRFRTAMQAVDPTIKLIATGQGNEFLPGGVNNDLGWNTAVLRAALANGPAPDYLSMHPLVPLPDGLRGFSYEEQFESAMSHPAFLDRTLLPALADGIRAVEGPAATTRIAPTEWGIIVGGRDWRQGPTHDALSGALFNALTLNAFLRHGDWVTLANMTALMHGGGIKKPNGIVTVDPQYYTQQLYAQAEPRIPVETDWEGPGRDVPQRGFLPGVPDVPNVDVFSALNGNRQRLIVFVVNRSLNDPQPIHLSVDGFNGNRGSATILTSPDPQTGNTWEHPDAVAPQPFPLPNSSGRMDYSLSLPPHSLVVMTWRR